MSEEGDELPPYEPTVVSGSSGPNAVVPPNNGLQGERHQHTTSKRRRRRKKKSLELPPHTGYTPFEQDHPDGYGYEYDYGDNDDFYDRAGYLSLLVCCLVFVIVTVLTLAVLGSVGYEQRRKH